MSLSRNIADFAIAHGVTPYGPGYPDTIILIAEAVEVETAREKYRTNILDFEKTIENGMLREGPDVKLSAAVVLLMLRSLRSAAGDT